MTEAADIGRTLGGGRATGAGGAAAPTSTNAATTPEDVRRRRLAALEGGVAAAAATTSSSALVGGGGGETFVASSPSSSSAYGLYPAVASAAPPQRTTTGATIPTAVTTSKRTTFAVEDDDDAELQAALALSLQQLSPAGGSADGLATMTDASQQQQQYHYQVQNQQQQQQQYHQQPPFETLENIEQLVQEWYSTGEPFDIASFHNIMWDASLTTESDQIRWLGQGIDVRQVETTAIRSASTVGSSSSTTMKPTPTTVVCNDTSSDPTGTMPTYRTMLDELSSSHLPWGLQQQFGGPCGVLAAVQAEMLRLLVFGRRGIINASSAAAGGSSSSGTLKILDYPETAMADPVPAELLTKDLFHQALARSLGILLARAALTPSVVSTAGTPSTTATSSSSSSLSTTQQQQQQQQQHSMSPPPAPIDQVRVVLPSRPTYEPLAWSDLEPWNTTHLANGSGNNTENDLLLSSTTKPTSKSTMLTVYTITLPELTDTSIIGGPKRQKMIGPEQHVQQQQQKQQSSSSSSISAGDQYPFSHDDYDSAALEERVHRLARVVGDFLLAVPPYAQQQQQKTIPTSSSSPSLSATPPPLDYFRRHGGVLLFVASMVASRGFKTVQEEFDDPRGSRLTSQFGHCAQELINLLLTGQAVSNVFDHTLKPSGDMECRGIQTRPTIGYLTQLESLRLCEVGSFYKSPRYPIWVVGSTSHFTVLFGSANALKESKSDMLLEKCRRAFKAVEGGEENGFITSDKLGSVLMSLGLDIGGDSALQTLAASIEVTGAGIILWDDFWKTTSRLMTGASIENVLASDEPQVVNGPVQQHQRMNISDNPCPSPPLMITDEPHNSQHPGTPAASAAASSSALSITHGGGVEESDEEMARRLAAEFSSYDTTSSNAGMSALTAAARVSSPMDVDTSTTTMMSDEELARKLQAEWDAEVAGANSVDIGGSNGSDHAVNGSPDHVFPDCDDSKALPPTPPHNSGSVEEDSKPPAIDLTRSPRRQEFEQYGDSFELYHYNGLRGGVLTPFRVTRLTAEEAVGASIALNHGSAGAGQGDGKSGDLEDVIRTKWPSCMINWLGQLPPYIN